VIAEAADFAASVALAADRTLRPPDAWRPGVPADDAVPALSHALQAAGWLDLAEDAELAPMAGLAGVELGRRLAPLRDLDALLGGSPLMVTGAGAAAGAIRVKGGAAPPVGGVGGAPATPVRGGAETRSATAHGRPGDAVGGLVRGGAEIGVVLDGATLARHAVLAAEPVAYGDDAGVHRVTAAHALRAVPAEPALAAWIAASTGYLAGLADHALQLALAHTKDRRAFGATLAALPPVQQRLADAATATRGLVLLAAERPGPAALAHAAAAAAEVTAACHQVTGAIGFTLEFPLQRASRRARAMQLWTDAFLA
jgi:alkylation response protein AidB-like acyl-CoA dehydrogenase